MRTKSTIGRRVVLITLTPLKWIGIIVMGVLLITIKTIWLSVEAVFARTPWAKKKKVTPH